MQSVFLMEMPRIDVSCFSCLLEKSVDEKSRRETMDPVNGKKADSWKIWMVTRIKKQSVPGIPMYTLFFVFHISYFFAENGRILFSIICGWFVAIRYWFA